MNVELAIRTAIIGAGATACVDLWALVRRAAFGQPLPDWSLVGRWFAWLPRGRLHHASIATTPPVLGETAIGWSVHYAIGVAFATVLVVIQGAAWVAHPVFLPAIALGVATVAAPFLILQPAMGAGIAGSRTRSPTVTRLHSLVTHAIFGLGLFLTAWLLRT